MDIHHTKWLVFFALSMLLLTCLTWIIDLEPRPTPPPTVKEDTIPPKDPPPPQNSADDVYDAFLRWKATNKPVPTQTDKYLQKPEKDFPIDYRFTLERAIALAQGYGHKEKENDEHKHSYDFLKIATIKALRAGKSEEMLQRLVNEKNMDKYRRERKVPTWWNFDNHAKHWDSIVRALENKDIQELSRYPQEHTHSKR